VRELGNHTPNQKNFRLRLRANDQRQKKIIKATQVPKQQAVERENPHSHITRSAPPLISQPKKTSVFYPRTHPPHEKKNLLRNVTITPPISNNNNHTTHRLKTV